MMYQENIVNTRIYLTEKQEKDFHYPKNGT